jgi:uncharacterized repeat protein (TIGR01451 family)/CSLREA domain-containing protein
VRVPLIAALVVVLVLPATASADVFTVTKTDDDVNCVPGNCSLRGAISAANGNPGADTINVPAGHYQLTQTGDDDTGDQGDLDINEEVTINGSGATGTIVDAGNDQGSASLFDRVFDVQPLGGPPFSATIRDLTIRGGDSSEGGGVRNAADLTLQRVIVRNNLGFSGGGIAHTNEETFLHLLDSTVTENNGVFGGGVAQEASAPEGDTNAGILIDRTTISGNRVGTGGEGDPDGGGIAVNGSGVVEVRNSTVTANAAEGLLGDASGGGAYVNAGRLTVTNSTISDNHVVSGYGGGIANTDGDLTLLNATVTGNSAEEGETERRSFGAAAVTDPGNPSQPGGNIDSFGDTTVFKNTIVSAGSPQNCRGRFNTVFTSNGHNLDSQNSCGFDQSSDLTATDPLLGNLASNGGPTQTHALLKGSPALDSADNAACPSADQRGVTRPQPAGGTCDRGAFEREAIDLSIQKLASSPAVRVGEEVRFTLAIANAGPGDATGVKVTDTLPDGLEFVAAEPSQGTCSGTTTITCDLGTVAAEQSVDVVIRARATREGQFTNTATVGSDGNFPEVTNANNTASANVSASPDAQPCRDTVAPITELKRSRVRVRRGKVHLSGVSYDPDPCASGVNRVLVSLARVKGRHLVNCRFIRSKTQYLLTPSPGMNCQDPVLFRAKGGSSVGTARTNYSFIYFVDLPDGIYRAQARAFDNAGNKERPTKGRNIRKFYVNRR